MAIDFAEMVKQNNVCPAELSIRPAAWCGKNSVALTPHQNTGEASQIKTGDANTFNSVGQCSLRKVA